MKKQKKRKPEETESENATTVKLLMKRQTSSAETEEAAVAVPVILRIVWKQPHLLTAAACGEARPYRCKAPPLSLPLITMAEDSSREKMVSAHFHSS
jgi:hypothetical protein